MQASQQRMRTSRGCWRRSRGTASLARSAGRRWPLSLWQPWALSLPLVRHQHLHVLCTASLEQELHGGEGRRVPKRPVLLAVLPAHGMLPSEEVSASNHPAWVLCAGKTLEVRRSEAGGDRGKGSTARDLERLFLIAQEDRHRPRIGLSPLPMPVPPPPPPSEYAFISS